RPSGETAGLLSPSAGDCGFVNCRFSPVSSEITNKESALPSPGESVTTRQELSGHQPRNPGLLTIARADVGQFAFWPAQRRDQPQFALAGYTHAWRRFASEERNPASVGRPDGIEVGARIGRQPQRRAGADLLHVDVGVVLLRPGPREDDVIAVGRKRGIT